MLVVNEKKVEDIEEITKHMQENIELKYKDFANGIKIPIYMDRTTIFRKFKEFFNMGPKDYYECLKLKFIIDEIVDEQINTSKELKEKIKKYNYANKKELNKKCYNNILDDEFIIEVISRMKSSKKLSHIPENKRSYKVCMYAVKNYSYELRSVPMNIIDEDICIQAVLRNPTQIDYVPIEKMTSYFWGNVIYKIPTLLKYMPYNLIDKSISVNALHNSHSLMEYLPTQIIDDDIIFIYEKKLKEFNEELENLLK